MSPSGTGLDGGAAKPQDYRRARDESTRDDAERKAREGIRKCLAETGLGTHFLPLPDHSPGREDEQRRRQQGKRESEPEEGSSHEPMIALPL